MIAPHADLPRLLRKSQARAFLQISPRTLDRMLTGDGALADAKVKLGDSERSPVRIDRDEMLRALGLVSKAQTHRDRKQAAAERHAAAAVFGES